MHSHIQFSKSAMKTTQKNLVTARPLACSWFACLCFALVAPTARAELAEPDNILYGTITLDSLPVTASHSDVVIEARRVPGGPPIAAYRMGADPQLGNFYALRLHLESFLPLADSTASQVGDTVYLVVSDASDVRVQTTYVLGDRGRAQRLDLSTAAALDSDADGLPDAWEMLHFGNLNQGAASINANGQTALQNFIAGTDPNDSTSTFKLDLALSNGLTRVSFFALRADGSGYEGMNRSYSLETSPNSASGPFAGLANYTNVPGANQTVVFETPSTNSATFYRARVWLHNP